MPDAVEPRQSRVLNAVERLGNALPDPVFIFLGMIVLLVAVSVTGEIWGWSAVNPVSGEVLQVQSLLSEDNVRRLITEMPRTYVGFTPLAFALLIMLGAGVAEGGGLLACLLRAGLSGVNKAVLTPVVFIIGMLTTHAFDAGYLVYVPLAGLAFAAAGRNPLLGLVVGFAGAAVGLSGNLFPGQYDVLILGITQTAARLLQPDWTLNPLGNWWFSLALAAVFTATVWVIADRVAAPRLGPWTGDRGEAFFAAARLSGAERSGLAAAGVWAAALAVGFAALALNPLYSPLTDENATGMARLAPLYAAIVPGFFLLFLVTGWAYGARVGSIKSHRDVVAMMAKGIEGLVPYLVLIFFGAHFVALFGWSNLGPIIAIQAAAQLRAMNAPPELLLPMLATMSASLDFLIMSGSAKWTAMAPVATPMMMLLGISPEMTTAVYRLGDTITNLISPLNPYLILTLTFCRRWLPDFRLGSLIALTLPFAVAFYLGGMALTIAWVSFELPVGPGASVYYEQTNLLPPPLP
jgi:aminobenzoyl-glutamate transport protein